jgi:hypothetical protein
VSRGGFARLRDMRVTSETDCGTSRPERETCTKAWGESAARYDGSRRENSSIVRS